LTLHLPQKGTKMSKWRTEHTILDSPLRAGFDFVVVKSADAVEDVQAFYTYKKEDCDKLCDLLNSAEEMKARLEEAEGVLRRMVCWFDTQRSLLRTLRAFVNQQHLDPRASALLK